MMGEVRWFHYVGVGLLVFALGAGMYFRLQHVDKPTAIAAPIGSAPSTGPAEDSVPPPKR